MTVERVAPAFVLELLIPLLAPRLPVAVASEVPNPRPDEFVTIRAAGSARSDSLVLHSRSVVVWCWARSDLRAGRLAELTLAEIVALARDPAAPDVRAVEVWGAPVRLDDPEITPPHPRYQFAVAPTLRGHRL